MTSETDLFYEEKLSEHRAETDVQPDPQHHAAMLCLGLRHRLSRRDERGSVYHSYEAEPGRSPPNHARFYGLPTTNPARSNMIAGVRRHFAALGYYHVCRTGRQGIHWFGKRTMGETGWESPKLGARMDTAHGSISVVIEDHTRRTR